MLTILKNKNFSLLMFGNATSILGTLMLNLALSLYVLQLTNSATQFSFVLSLQLLATACLSPFAGTLVDGWNKRKTVIYLDLIRGLFALGMFLLSLHSSLNMAFVYFIVLFYSLSEIFFNPAFASMIPKIVEKEELPNANALYGVIADTSYALAPLIGTSLYALTNISTVLLVTGITYLVSSIVEGFMFFEEENTKGEKVHYLENVMSGFKLLWLDKKITALFTNDVLSHLIIFPFISVGIPYIMLTLLENSEQSYGIIQSIATIGSIASFLLLPILKKRFSIETSTSIGLYGVIIFGFLLTPLMNEGFLSILTAHSLWSVLFFGSTHFILYLSFAVYLIFYTTLYQSIITPEKIGRFVSVETTFHSMARLIGVLLFGFLFENFPIQLPLLVLVAASIMKLVVHLPFLKAQRLEKLECSPESSHSKL